MRIRHECIKTLSVRRRHPYGASANNLRSERIMKRRRIKLIEYYELNKNILSEWQLNKLKTIINVHINTYFELTTNPAELDFQIRYTANDRPTKWNDLPCLGSCKFKA